MYSRTPISGSTRTYSQELSKLKKALADCSALVIGAGAGLSTSSGFVYDGGRFVEDEGWHRAAQRYEDFLAEHTGKVLFLELGVGYNTPVIIKYPFWRMTARDPEAVYACINYSDAVCPDEIKDRSVCIGQDIARVLSDLN